MKRRALLGATAGVAGLAGCPFDSVDVSLLGIEIDNLDLTSHEVHVVVSEGEETVLLDSITVPAARRERGTLHAESMTVDLPTDAISDFTVQATLAGSDEIRRLEADDFEESGEIYVKLYIDRDGLLAIFHSASPV